MGDGGNDHGRWLRPEDIDYIQESFKIDQNNPGTEVAAETAAALAAASIVFQNEDLAYSRMLLSHAYDLYSFADLFRYCLVEYFTLEMSNVEKCRNCVLSFFLCLTRSQSKRHTV